VKAELAVVTLAFLSTACPLQAQSAVPGIVASAKHPEWSLSCSPKVSSVDCKWAGFYASGYTSYLNTIPVVIVTPQEFNQEVDRLAAKNSPPLPSGFCSEATRVLSGCSHNGGVLILKATPGYAAPIGLIYVSTSALKGVRPQVSSRGKYIAVPDKGIDGTLANGVFSFMTGYVWGYNAGVLESHPPVPVN
jgi:hypothetical protein